MLERLRDLIRKPRTSEDDVRPNANVARSRETGGRATDDDDSAATTGVGRSEEFVGRAAGQDEGYAGDTGAEARARGSEGGT